MSKKKTEDLHHQETLKADMIGIENKTKSPYMKFCHLIHNSGLIIAPYIAFADVQSNFGPRRMIASTFDIFLHDFKVPTNFDL